MKPEENLSARQSKSEAEEKRPGARDGKFCNDWRLEVLALGGFCVSGVFFVLSGLRSGDDLTVIGSLVWIASCLLWMIPYRKYLR